MKHYEVSEQRVEPGVWTVEYIDLKTGECEKTNFYGPGSEERAKEYADFKNNSQGA